MTTEVQRYIAAKRGEQDAGAIRLTVRIGQRNYAKLMKLSVELGAAKTSLAGDLLEASISDAWKELGLPEPSLEESTRYEEAIEHTDAVRASFHSLDEGEISVTNTWIFQANPK